MHDIVSAMRGARAGAVSQAATLYSVTDTARRWLENDADTGGLLQKIAALQKAISLTPAHDHVQGEVRGLLDAVQALLRNVHRTLDLLHDAVIRVAPSEVRTCAAAVDAQAAALASLQGLLGARRAEAA